MRDIHQSHVRVVPLVTLRQLHRLLLTICALQLIDLAFEIWRLTR